MLIIKYDSFIEEYDHNAVKIYLLFTLNQKKGKRKKKKCSNWKSKKIILGGK